MRNLLYPRLAAQSLKNNRQFFLPYILTISGSAAAMYIMSALTKDSGVNELRGAAYVQSTMLVGMFIATLFTMGVLLYTNSFLMKRRKKELGLYNILGMGKGHITVILCLEGLYTALIGVGSGLLLGMLLHKLVALVMCRLLFFPVPFGFSVSPAALVQTAVIFAVMLSITLLTNLFRVQVSRPIELLRGGEVGEREPRTRSLLTLLGIATLGAGYFIAVTTKNAFSALALYFVAVALVIVGTYCLFTAVSVFVLKALRRNKRFYYQTGHFIGISGMLHRMKQNAVGLANICILSTMVMVMLSGTLSLYLGTEAIVDARCPADLMAEVRYDPRSEEPFRPDAMEAAVAEFIQSRGIPVEGARSLRYQRLYALREEDGYLVEVDDTGARQEQQLYFLTAADYAALTGNPAPTLAPGQAALAGHADLPASITLHGNQDITLTVTEHLPVIDFFRATVDDTTPLCLILPDDRTFDEIYRLQADRYQVPQHPRWISLYDLDCTAQEAEALDSWIWDDDTDPDTGDWESLRLHVRSLEAQDGYALAGGFLFLGIFLSAVFLMATVLIMYYKQVSEGYEDRTRFEIMQKVGLTREEVRASIRGQVLMVFFLPIVVAAVHILFDFNLVVQLLRLFGLENLVITALCTGGTVLVFFGAYAVMYLLTARTYYKIVS